MLLSPYRRGKKGLDCEVSLNLWRDLIPKPLYFRIHLCPLKRFLIRKSGTLSSLFGDEVIEHHPVLLYKILSCWSLMHVQATPPRGLAFYPRLKLTKSDNVFVPYLLYHCFFLSFFLLPSSGHLLRRQTASEPLENGRVLAQGSSFTYQDILAGLVGYMPGGPGVAVDEFQFSLTDGLHTDTGRMEIYIELPTSDTPHLAVNRGLQLSAGTRAWKRVAMVSSLFLHNASFHVSSVGGS